MKWMMLSVSILIICAAVWIGCADTPAGIEMNITNSGNGNVNVDLENTEQDVVNGGDQNGDIDLGGGCCDGEPSDPGWDGGCYSVPSCTQVPCETCAMFGGWRDCQTQACNRSE